MVLSTCMEVGSWGCLISLRVLRIGKSSLVFIKVVFISASAAEYMQVLMSWHRLCMAPLLVGRVGGLSPFWTSWSAKRKMASRSATCVFFIEIGRIVGNVDDHVVGMIVDCGIRLDCPVV